MALIMIGDGLESVGGSLGVVEGEQAFSGRYVVLEPGGLGHYRTTGGEVTNAAIAEPSRAQTGVLVLGDCEFASRALDEAPILHRRVQPPGVGDDPTLFAQPIPVPISGAPKRQFERHRRAGW